MGHGVLHTIGYERAAFLAVAGTLADAGVTMVVDVRAEPHSRRREFAFKHLGPGLAAYGIAYASWPELGTPAAGRGAAKQGDAMTFHRLFMEQLATPAARNALAELAALVERETLCLLCYERDPAHCHRTLIVERMAATHGIAVRDLIPTQRS